MYRKRQWKVYKPNEKDQIKAKCSFVGSFPARSCHQKPVMVETQSGTAYPWPPPLPWEAPRAFPLSGQHHTLGTPPSRILGLHTPANPSHLLIWTEPEKHQAPDFDLIRSLRSGLAFIPVLTQDIRAPLEAKEQIWIPVLLTRPSPFEGADGINGFLARHH